MVIRPCGLRMELGSRSRPRPRAPTPGTSSCSLDRSTKPVRSSACLTTSTVGRGRRTPCSSSPRTPSREACEGKVQRREHRHRRSSPSGRHTADVPRVAGRREQPRPFRPTDATSRSRRTRTAARRSTSVRSSVGAGGQWRISTKGRATTRWSGDGRTVFYLGTDLETLHGVHVSASPTFTVGSSEVVATIPGLGEAWDVDRKSGRMILTQAVATQNTRIIVLMNWLDEFRRTSAAGR